MQIRELSYLIITSTNAIIELYNYIFTSKKTH